MINSEISNLSDSTFLSSNENYLLEVKDFLKIYRNSMKCKSTGKNIFLGILITLLQLIFLSVTLLFLFAYYLGLVNYFYAIMAIFSEFFFNIVCTMMLFYNFDLEDYIRDHENRLMTDFNSTYSLSNLQPETVEHLEAITASNGFKQVIAIEEADIISTPTNFLSELDETKL